MDSEEGAEVGWSFTNQGFIEQQEPVCLPVGVKRGPGPVQRGHSARMGLTGGPVTNLMAA